MRINVYQETLYNLSKQLIQGISSLKLVRRTKLIETVYLKSGTCKLFCIPQEFKYNYAFDFYKTNITIQKKRRTNPAKFVIDNIDLEM